MAVKLSAQEQAMLRGELGTGQGSWLSKKSSDTRR
jgi:hypothetical protein